MGRANVCALQSDATDSFYNVGTGLGTSILDLTKLICELAGHPPKVELMPEGQSFVTHRIGSTGAAARALGFEAEVDLREGLLRLIDWRRADRASVVPHSPAGLT